MSIINDIYKQINNITIALNDLPLKTANFPNNKEGSIGRTPMHNYWIWYMLNSDLSYQELYDLIIKRQDYNFIMPDWWIFQYLYSFDKSDNLVKHRLAYYPKLQEIQYWEWDLSDFESEYYKEDLVVEQSYKNKIVIPTRFDFDCSEDNFIEFDHSYSHMTIGWFKNCRITVDKPITPFQFTNFILKSFYNCVYLEYNFFEKFWIDKDIILDPKISDNERDLTYISI